MRIKIDILIKDNIKIIVVNDQTEKPELIFRNNTKEKVKFLIKDD